MAGGILAQAKALSKTLQANTRVDLPDDIRKALGYFPRDLQARLDAQDRRFNVRVLHRRFGKTVREVAKLFERAVECPFPNGRYAYLAPTYAAAEDIAWMYVKEFHGALMRSVGRDPEPLQNASKLCVFVPTRLGGVSRIRLYGVDSPKQRLRGLYLDGVVFDEFAQIPWSVWAQQVRPMLSDDVRTGNDRLGRRNQWADFIFTPFGRNHAHTLFRKAEAWTRGDAVTEIDPVTEREIEIRRDDWHAALYKASETGIIAKDELAAAMYEMGRPKFEQEYECSFDAAVEGAVYAKDIEALRQMGRIRTDIIVNPLRPVHTAWDLGFDDACAIWFFQQIGDEVRIVDYLELRQHGLPQIVEKLAAKGYRYGYHLLPWDVAIHDIGSGKSRHAILRECGVHVTTVPKHNVFDGIPAVQALLPRCVFREQTTHRGIDGLALYRRDFDEQNDILREKPVHDWASHPSDAFRTLAMGLKRMRGTDEEPQSFRSAELG